MTNKGVRYREDFQPMLQGTTQTYTDTQRGVVCKKDWIVAIAGPQKTAAAEDWIVAMPQNTTTGD
jgi:hypothetical protein